MHDDARAKVRQLLAQNGLSQAKLAERAGISQSTVSRALHGSSQRHGRARSKLFTYAQNQETTEGILAEDGPKRVVKAFDRIWDGTDAHAAAIVKILNALAGLRPAGSPKKRGIREGQGESPQATAKKRRSE